MQDEIAIIRDCNARLQELRSSLTSLGKQDLIDKKEKIKLLAREHRDDGSLGNEELEEKIAEVEKIDADEAAVNEKIAKMAENYGQTVEDFSKNLRDEDRKYIAEEAKVQKIADFLTENAKITEAKEEKKDKKEGKEEKEATKKPRTTKAKTKKEE